MIRKWIPLWVWPMILVCAVLTVWLRLSIVGKTYELGQTDQMIRNAKQEAEKLELKLTQLKSPKNLELLAKKKFNLDRPEAHQVVRVTE